MWILWFSGIGIVILQYSYLVLLRCLKVQSLVLAFGMRWFLVVCALLGVTEVLAGGGTKNNKKKKPTSVKYPYSLVDISQWTELGLATLRLSCEEAGLSAGGTGTQLAHRLHNYYHPSTASQGKRGFFVFEIICGINANFVTCGWVSSSVRVWW